MERLDKVVSNAGIASRSETKKYIRAGRVRVNGEVVKNEAFKVSEDDLITCDGNSINKTGLRYFMLNKPAGLVSATEDRKEKTVIDLFKNEGIKDLFPVGRLDKDTTGLLLVTNDGDFGHRMTSPNHNVDKVYIAEVDGIPGNEAVSAFAAGFEFKDFTSKSAKLEILEINEADNTSVNRVTIHEGKFHQVKRMFEKVGCEVLKLKRISMGSFILDENLAEGIYKELTSEEVFMLEKGEGTELLNSNVSEDGNNISKEFENSPEVRNNKNLSGMLKGVKAVIFDLDGTLTDSMGLWKQIDIDFLGRFGIELPDDLQAAICGMSFEETACYFKSRFNLSMKIGEIMKTWNDMADDFYRNRVHLKNGALDFLKYLKKQGIKTGIATSNSQELVETVAVSEGFSEYIDEIHNCCEVEKGKPSPLIYLHVAECLGVNPEECLVFEDLCVGIEAGNSAGMRTVAVEDDFSAGEWEEKKRLADYYIKDFDDLRDLTEA